MTGPNLPTVDASAFHEWRSIRDLAPYMSSGWAEAFLRPNSPTGPQPPTTPLMRHPTGRQDPAAYPEKGPAGSDFERFEAQVLAPGGRDRVVLGYDEAGLMATAFTNTSAANVLVAAVNDWTLDQWLSRDSRVGGLILVSMNNPERAAAEVRRLGSRPEFVGVALGTNGLGMPFGHAVYHPVYQAAAELGLPIVVQAGSDSSPSLLSPPIGGGVAATYAETEIWAAHPLMTHAATLVFDGVFEMFPSLKLLLVGGGVGWLPSAIWRMDFWWSSNRLEAPLLQRPPSEYFREHVRVATAGMETPADAGRLQTILGTVPWLEEVLVYASGYPNVGWLEPHEVAPRLPEGWVEALDRNARDLFRFSSDLTSPKAAVASGAGAA